jgi:hypothetical protein
VALGKIRLVTPEIPQATANLRGNPEVPGDAPHLGCRPSCWLRPLSGDIDDGEQAVDVASAMFRKYMEAGVS